MAQPAFPTCLDAFEPELLEADRSVLVVLDAKGTILWTNPAWRRFAEENGGAAITERFGVGTSYFAGISPPLRDYYQCAFANALLVGEPFVQDYECSSPEVYRGYRMRALPVRGALLVEHSLLVEHAHDREPAEGIESRYRSAQGLVVQCANCRRVRRVENGAWDWVPGWVAQPPRDTSHGICGACVGFYFGALLRGRGKPT